IEAIRLILAYASFKDFVVYQMDVNSAFLYGKIEEEVYVCQPPRFKDPDFPDRVYKVEKALYGLHQAPRAWYETLSTYLLDNGFERGKINKTLFIKRHKGDILLVQVYVDDIIFGLQVKQKNDCIFICQDKYVVEILKKFGFTKVKNASTPIESQKSLLKNEDGKEVDVHMYRVDGKKIIITESSVRRDLRLADKNGVDSFTNSTIFENFELMGDNALTELRKKFKKAKKERDDLKLTLEKLENSSKNLIKLLDSQICNKFKTGVWFDSQVFDNQVNDRYKIGEGYHAVPPSYIGNFMPPKPDLILADVDEYVLSESVTSVPAVATSEAKTSETKPKPSKSVSEDIYNEVRESPNAPLVKELVLDDKLDKKIIFSTVAKIEFVRPKQQEKPVKYAEMYRSQCPRGNQRN
nr:putative ribonuclease H-like domain-containing protein [Tanacetum cinerariifolium]